MKKTLLATLILGALGCSLTAIETAPPRFDDYFSFLSAGPREQLRQQNELTSVPGSASVALRSPVVDAEVRRTLSVTHPTLVAEGWFLFPRPSGTSLLGLYNAINNISSMEGLEYYSVSQKKRQPLILASYRISSPGNAEKLTDPVFQAIPETQKAYIFQRDNRLGDGASELTWRESPPGALSLSMRNLEPLTMAFVTLVEPSGLQMLFLVQPLTDRIAVYGLVEAQTISLFGWEKSKEESYRNRMRALADWVGTRIATLR